MMLVTLEQAKNQCYIDHDEDDMILEIYIKSASAAISEYLKRDDLTQENAPLQAKQATLAYVGLMYRNRDGDPDGDYEHGYLPHFVTAILYPLRVPTVK